MEKINMNELIAGFDTNTTGSPYPRNRRQQKLTEKGKAYRLEELRRQRNRSKTDVRKQINSLRVDIENKENHETFERNLKTLSDKFKHFVDTHEQMLDITEDEVDVECHDKLCRETMYVQQLARDYKSKVNDNHKSIKSKSGRNSVKSCKPKNSRMSKASRMSSRAKMLEAKAKHAELSTRLAVLGEIETAENIKIKANREAERIKLQAECRVAEAVSKIYEEVMYDSEQDLGSDDPDIVTECIQENHVNDKNDCSEGIDVKGENDSSEKVDVDRKYVDSDVKVDVERKYVDSDGKVDVEGKYVGSDVKVDVERRYVDSDEKVDVEGKYVGSDEKVDVERKYVDSSDGKVDVERKTDRSNEKVDMKVDVVAKTVSVDEKVDMKIDVEGKAVVKKEPSTFINRADSVQLKKDVESDYSLDACRRPPVASSPWNLYNHHVESYGCRNVAIFINCN